jgi:hypothetical protein
LFVFIVWKFSQEWFAFFGLLLSSSQVYLLQQQSLIRVLRNRNLLVQTALVNTGNHVFPFYFDAQVAGDRFCHVTKDAYGTQLTPHQHPSFFYPNKISKLYL